VAVGSDDGVVRIWGGIYRSESLHLVTAWQVLSVEGEEPFLNSGLVLEWQQKNAIVIAAGNIDVLKVWDINRELFLQDILTNSNCPVTCLTSDKTEGERLIVVGCCDGSVRLFDRRVGTKFMQVAAYTEHKRFVIISGSASGEIKFWDVRNTKTSIRQISSSDSKGENQMTTLAVHEYAPILALGQDQIIKVMNFSGERSCIRYHGCFGQRIGPVSALRFHPFQVILGAGATDSIVSIYAEDQFNI